jgi:succinate dehydrogenase flavin-adding protein (antitoxin of CptAB toxin-antitoxin module)
MSKTKELDRIANNVYNQAFEHLYETVAMELEYSDLEDINDNELHEYVMNQVINKFIQK